MSPAELTNPAGCAEALLGILRREHAALLAGVAETIQQIAAEKQQAVSVMESLSERLVRQPDALTTETRAHFLAVAAECRRQNDINGSMVAASLRHLQQFIALMHGHNPQTSVYERAGQSQLDFGTRPLAKA